MNCDCESLCNLLLGADWNRRQIIFKSIGRLDQLLYEQFAVHAANIDCSSISIMK